MVRELDPEAVIDSPTKGSKRQSAAITTTLATSSDICVKRIPQNPKALKPANKRPADDGESVKASSSKGRAPAPIEVHEPRASGKSRAQAGVVASSGGDGGCRRHVLRAQEAKPEAEPPPGALIRAASSTRGGSSSAEVQPVGEKFSSVVPEKVATDGDDGPPASLDTCDHAAAGSGSGPPVANHKVAHHLSGGDGTTRSSPVPATKRRRKKPAGSPAIAARMPLVEVTSVASENAFGDLERDPLLEDFDLAHPDGGLPPGREIRSPSAPNEEEEIDSVDQGRLRQLERHHHHLVVVPSPEVSDALHRLSPTTTNPATLSGGPKAESVDGKSLIRVLVPTTTDKGKSEVAEKPTNAHLTNGAEIGQNHALKQPGDKRRPSKPSSSSRPAENVATPAAQSASSPFKFGSSSNGKVKPSSSSISANPSAGAQRRCLKKGGGGDSPDSTDESWEPSRRARPPDPSSSSVLQSLPSSGNVAALAASDGDSNEGTTNVVEMWRRRMRKRHSDSSRAMFREDSCDPEAPLSASAPPNNGDQHHLAVAQQQQQQSVGNGEIGDEVERKVSDDKGQSGKSPDHGGAVSIDSNSPVIIDKHEEGDGVVMPPDGGRRAALLDSEDTEEARLEIKRRLESFEHISENKFVCERRYNKQTRGMECDCSLSKEDARKGLKGCGDDCLNRLLMIECGKSCSLGKHCANRRFQNVENAPTEVFKTSWKGIGLRATKDIPGDTFIIEYVGEVLDPQKFRKRARKYSKDDVQHFYFMALSSDYFLDASEKGNVSRFINHSCDPNAETQKWTVDGELRVGFFSKRTILKGEEITFDYKYERYGQHAQKCFCGSSNCRGWLGGEPDKENRKPEASDDEADDDEDADCWSSSSSSSSSESEADSTAVAAAAAANNQQVKVKHLPAQTLSSSSSSSPSVSPHPSAPIFAAAAPLVSASSAAGSTPVKIRRQIRRRVRKSPRKIKNFEDGECDEEVERLKSTGIRTKGHTVELCRLMVRTTDVHKRVTLAELLRAADPPCRRLFLDYHGLKILSGWMAGLGWEVASDLDLKVAVEDALAVLNIPHKTMLVESKVWHAITQWSAVDLGQVCAQGEQQHPGLVSSASPAATTGSRATSPGNQSQIGATETGPEVQGVLVAAEVSSSSSSSSSNSMSVDGHLIRGGRPDKQETYEAENLGNPGEKLVDYHQPSSSLSSTEMAGDAEGPCLPATVSAAAEDPPQEQGGGAEGLQEAVANSEDCKTEPMEVASTREAEGNDKAPPRAADQPESKGTTESPSPRGDEEDSRSSSKPAEVVAVKAEDEVKSAPQKDSDAIAAKVRAVKSKAIALLLVWKGLQEVFKIPKKELVALRAEHERQVDQAVEAAAAEQLESLASAASAAASSAAAAAAGLPSSSPSTINQLNRGKRSSYERSRPLNSSGGPSGNGEPRLTRFDDKTGLMKGGGGGGGSGSGVNCGNPGLTKEVRRQLFSLKVATEEEERRRRQVLQNWHENKCYYLRLDPALTPMFPELPEFFFDPTVGTWYRMPDLPLDDNVWEHLGFPRMAGALPDGAYRPDDPPLPDPAYLYPPGVVKVSYLYGQPMSLDPSYNGAVVDQPLLLDDPTTADAQDPSSAASSSSAAERGRHLPPLPDEPYDESYRHRGGHDGPAEDKGLEELENDDDDDDDEDDEDEDDDDEDDDENDDDENDDVDMDDEARDRQIIFGIHGAAAGPNVPMHGHHPSEDSPVVVVVSAAAAAETAAEEQTAAASESAAPAEDLDTSCPNDVVLRLPSGWKATTDQLGRLYFYHTVTQETRWEPPVGATSVAEDHRLGDDDDDDDEEVGLVVSAVEMETASTDSDDEEGDESDDEDEDDDSDNEDDAKAKTGPNRSQQQLSRPRPQRQQQLQPHSPGKQLLRLQPATQGAVEDLVSQTAPGAADTDPDGNPGPPPPPVIRKKTKEERQHERRQKRERDREKREYERKRRRERHGKHRKDGLVFEHIIPRRTEKEKTDLMTFREIRERLMNRDAIREIQEIEERAEAEREREEERLRLRLAEKEQRALLLQSQQLGQQPEKASSSQQPQLSPQMLQQQQQQPLLQLEPGDKDGQPHHGQLVVVRSAGSGSKPLSAAADTSSEAVRKMKERFKKNVSQVIVTVLDPYRKSNATVARIQSTEDFKHLARKLTNFVLAKELKHCPRIEDLRVSDSVKRKTAEFVKKYMAKFGDTYKRSPSTD